MRNFSLYHRLNHLRKNVIMITEFYYIKVITFVNISFKRQNYVKTNFYNKDTVTKIRQFSSLYSYPGTCHEKIFL